jgi:DNA-binding transcriptional LysR family regulator
VIPLLSKFRLPAFAIHAIYPHRRYLAAKVRSFIDLLAERSTEHQRWMDIEAVSTQD